jgi:hypothetical protein
VAQLRLDDIEWETGSLRVSGKSRYEVRLPLPQDVGDAIAAYLAWPPFDLPERSRVPAQYRAVSAVAPHSPRSPVPRANNLLSARTPQPRLNVNRRKAFATIPIVPNLPRLRSIRLL